MFVLQEGLNLNLVDEPLYQFRADFCEGDLLDGSDELSGIMLRAVDIAKSTLSQYLP